MSLPGVAIALPVYNGADYLQDALASFEIQTYPHFELVICDNVSTDRTPEIARRVCSKDRRFKYYRAKEHLDALGNFIRAYALTDRNQKYFLWACDDNIWAPRFLEKTVGYLEAHPECSLCGFFLHHFSDDGRITRLNRVPIPDLFKKVRFMQYAFEKTVGYSIYGLMRRQALDSLRFEFDCRCYHEFWYLLQLRARGTFHVIEEDLLGFREGGLSTTGDDPYVAQVVDLIFSDRELRCLFSLKELTPLEKLALAQKMTYIALRHYKPDTVRKWWLAPAYGMAWAMNRYRPSGHRPARVQPDSKPNLQRLDCL